MRQVPCQRAVLWLVLVACLSLVLASCAPPPKPQSAEPSPTKTQPAVPTTTKPAPTAPAKSPMPATITVYITNTGEKYHKDGCRSLSKSKIPVTLEQAKARGYGPCSVCKPPT